MSAAVAEPLRALAKRAYRSSGLREWRLSASLQRSIDEWHVLQREADARRARVDGADAGEGVPDGVRVVLVPPDPMLLTASRGDEAMLGSTLHHLRDALRADEIHVVTCSERADEAARALGVQPLRVLDDAGLRKGLDALLRIRPTHVWTLGADTIDGHSDPNFSMRLVALADLGARLGADARVLGFSFSANAHPRLHAVYDAVHPELQFNVRDPHSFERFQRFTSARSRLVADTAFLLEPEPSSVRTRAARAWIAERRDAGDTVVALNFHPLLLPLAQRHELPTSGGTAGSGAVDRDAGEPGEHRASGTRFSRSRVGSSLPRALVREAHHRMPGTDTGRVGRPTGASAERLDG